MSYVGKTTSDVEKIISDMFFASCNVLKSKSLQKPPFLYILLKLTVLFNLGGVCSFAKSFGYGITGNRGLLYICDNIN